MSEKNQVITSHGISWPRPKGELDQKKLFTSHDMQYAALGLHPDGTPIQSEQDRKLAELKKLAGELGFEIEDSAGNEKALSRDEGEVDGGFAAADGGDKPTGGGM